MSPEDHPPRAAPGRGRETKEGDEGGRRRVERTEGRRIARAGRSEMEGTGGLAEHKSQTDPDYAGLPPFCMWTSGLGRKGAWDGGGGAWGRPERRKAIQPKVEKTRRRDKFCFSRAAGVLVMAPSRPEDARTAWVSRPSRLLFLYERLSTRRASESPDGGRWTARQSQRPKPPRHALGVGRGWEGGPGVDSVYFRGRM